MKNQLRFALTLALAFAACAAVAEAQANGDYAITGSVIASGGGTSADGVGSVFAVTGTAGQAIAGTRSGGAPYVVVGGFYPAAFAPTAASVNLAGRILNDAGRGIRSVRVTLTESNGAPRTRHLRRVRQLPLRQHRRRSNRHRLGLCQKLSIPGNSSRRQRERRCFGR